MSGVSTASNTTGSDSTNLLDPTDTDLLSTTSPQTLYGNGGDNVFYVNNAATNIIESSYTNGDIVYSTVSYTLPKNVNNLTLLGSANLTATGNAGNDVLTANSGNDQLIGGTGVDTMIGGTGNDTFVVTNYGDVVIAQANAASNTLIAGGSYPGMPGNVQTMILTGSANLDANGNSLNDTIYANSGNDTIDGGSGNDTIHVGAGADRIDGYGGTNTVVFSGDLANYQIAMGSDGFQITDTTGHDGIASLTKIQIAQFADASVNLIDYSPEDGSVTGGSGDNYIITDRGHDLVTGGSGNDTFVVGGGSDTIIGGGGQDTVVFSGDEANYQITQTANGWTVTDTTGAQGTNLLTNIDTLQFADHTFNTQAVPTAPSLTVAPASGNQGSPIALNIASALASDGLPDTLSVVVSGVPTGASLSAGQSDGHGDWTLTAAQLQGLTLTPAASFTGELALQVTATATDTADGKTVASTASLDVDVNPLALAPTLSVAPASGNEGSPIALNIAAGLVADGDAEQLAITISGVPTGASLSAGQSDGHGDWTLTAAQLQGLTLTPAAPLAGNLALQVTATATDTIDGTTASTAASFDVLVNPVAQAPTLSVQAVSGNEGSPIALDIAAGLVPDGGSEQLAITISGVPTGASLSAGQSDGNGDWTLTAAQLQGLTLTPASSFTGDLALQVTATATEAANGTAASTAASFDVLVNSGAETLHGNGGDNVFYVNNAATDIIESSYTNGDIVYSTVSYTLPKNVNNLTLLGSANLTATGNAGNDVLTANSGNDQLIGGTGVDTMIGGTGNDTFVVTNYGDVVIAQANAASNTLIAGGSYPGMPGNVQTMILTGSANLDANGNSLNDTIYANSGNDTIDGGSGNDTIHVGAGADRIDGYGGTNTVVFSGDLANYQIAMGSDGFQITDTTGHDGIASLTKIQIAQFADASVNLIDYSPEDGSVTGGSGDNYIITDRGHDLVTGGSGNDTFVVGGGSDTIIGGGGQDTVVFSGDEANYQITQTANGWTVTDTTGAQGTNLLTNIDTLQFADHSYTLPTTAYSGSPPPSDPPPSDPPPTTTTTSTTGETAGGSTVVDGMTVNAAGLIVAPTVEQPTQPGDVVGVQIDNTASTAVGAQIYTFGEVFAQGDVPAGDQLVAVVNGQDIPLQMDVKTTYADGSVNNAILTVALPAIAANGAVNIMLATNSAPAAATPAVNAESILQQQSYDLSVNVNIHNADGTTTDYNVNAAQVVEQALQNGTAQSWLSGPLATEVLVTTNITSTLQATFDVRTMANGQVYTDVIFGYDNAYTVNNSNLTYDLDIQNNGQTVYSQTDMTQYQHTSWQTAVWSSGAAPTLNTVYDVPYMVSTGDIPAIDTSQQVSAADVEANYAALNASNTGPMGTALLTTYMGGTGQTDSATVGLLSGWETDWLLSQSPEAHAVMIAQANASGSIPWDFMDGSTGEPVTITADPGIRTSTNGPGTGATALPYTWNPSDTPWTPDTAHQPDLTYLSYLTTGSYYYLEQLQYQAAFDLTTENPQTRGGSEGLLNVPSNPDQVRAEAWDLRTLADAANASPTGSAMQAYFQTELNNNLAYEFQQFVTDNVMGDTGQLEGYIPGYNYNSEGLQQVAPWQQDFLAMTYGYLAQLGEPDAAGLLSFMTNFEAGRYLNGSDGYNPIFGSAYELNVINPTTGQPYDTWAQVFTATFGSETTPGGAEGIDTGYPDSAGGYWGTARGALATLITGTMSPDAIAAYGYVVQFTENAGLVQDYANDPNYEIAPKLANGQYLLNSNIQVDYSSNNITMTATPGQNSLLFAGSGNDLLQGGSGDDLLFGGSGNDTLAAGTGDDFIFAGSGKTTIVDGVGNDYMNAGTGADTFVFAENGSGHDTIAGFKIGVDQLDITANLNSNGITTAAELLAGATTDTAGDTVLHLSANDDIVLLGIAPSSLTAASVVMVH